jgi:hypothetical protein
MSQESIEIIMTIINNYLPSIVAVVTALASMIVAVKKVQGISKSSADELQKMNAALVKELSLEKKENRELKKLLTKTLAKAQGIKLPEKE